ncbi:MULTISPECIES: TniQ family protein [Pseudomonas]|uniref:TniQ family protein n=1 Tax=Pseudomonas TaxID=286 RepID=UPI0032F05326
MLSIPRLQIQPEESIRSYLERSLFLCWDSHAVDDIRKFQNKVRFFKSDLKEISVFLGWDGSYGFDRLISLHTSLAVNYVVKHSQDISYSRKLYPFKGEPYAEKNVSYCPECAKEDLARLGFSYWRRAYSLFENDTVCHKHNTLLLTRCPYCETSLGDPKHRLDVMWRGCDGHYLWEVEPSINSDGAEFQRARFNHSFCTSARHISAEAAVSAVWRKVKATMPEGVTTWHDIYWLEKDLELAAIRMQDQAVDNDAAHVESSLELIMKAIFSHYGDIDEFTRDIGEHGVSRLVQTGWGTYLAMGDESAWYVTEDYTMGLAVLSCPYPCGKSMRLSSQSAFRDLDSLYHYSCCMQNDSPSRRLIKRSHLVLPPVPRLDIKTRQNMGHLDGVAV